MCCCWVSSPLERTMHNPPGTPNGSWPVPDVSLTWILSLFPPSWCILAGPWVALCWQGSLRPSPRWAHSHRTIWRYIKWYGWCSARDYFMHAPSQWGTTLQCNVVSHWLGACTKWFLQFTLNILQSLISNKVTKETHSLRYSCLLWVKESIPF